MKNAKINLIIVSLVVVALIIWGTVSALIGLYEKRPEKQVMAEKETEETLIDEALTDEEKNAGAEDEPTEGNDGEEVEEQSDDEEVVIEECDNSWEEELYLTEEEERKREEELGIADLQMVWYDDEPLMEEIKYDGRNPKNEAVSLFFGDMDTTKAVFNYDMDLDGISEKICFERYTARTWILYSGDKKLVIRVTGADAIFKVYGIDLDKNDNSREIAVITAETDWGANALLRIFRKNENFEYVNFKAVDKEEGVTRVFAQCGAEPDFGIEYGDGMLTTVSRGGFGMWDTKDFFIYRDGAMISVSKEESEIVYDNRWGLSDDELIKRGELPEMYRKGFVTAKADWKPDENTPEHKDIITITEGERFRVVKEDVFGFVMIEKETGDTGWIYVGQIGALSYIAEVIFYVAG